MTVEKRKRKTELVHVRVDPETKRRLRSLARSNGHNVSEELRKILGTRLDNAVNL